MSDVGGPTDTAAPFEQDRPNAKRGPRHSLEGDGSDDVELMTVRLLQFPVKLGHAFSRHHEELLREFALLAVAADHDSASVPRGLLELVNSLSDQYSGFSRQPQAELAAALERGAATVDLDFVVPVSAAHAARALNQQLDAAEASCRNGQLLTLSASPELGSFRIWFLEEFVRQAGGAPPRPFDPGRPPGSWRDPR
jgi:hypothetical protein